MDLFVCMSCSIWLMFVGVVLVGVVVDVLVGL